MYALGVANKEIRMDLCHLTRTGKTEFYMTTPREVIVERHRSIAWFQTNQYIENFHPKGILQPYNSTIFNFTKTGGLN